MQPNVTPCHTCCILDTAEKGREEGCSPGSEMQAESRASFARGDPSAAAAASGASKLRRRPSCSCSAPDPAPAFAPAPAPLQASNARRWPWCK